MHCYQAGENSQSMLFMFRQKLVYQMTMNTDANNHSVSLPQRLYQCESVHSCLVCLQIIAKTARVSVTFLLLW